MSDIIREARAWVAAEVAQRQSLAALQDATDRAFVMASSVLDPSTLCIIVTATSSYSGLSVRTGTTDRALAAVALRRAAEFLESGGGRV